MENSVRILPVSILPRTEESNNQLLKGRVYDDDNEIVNAAVYDRPALKVGKTPIVVERTGTPAGYSIKNKKNQIYTECQSLSHAAELLRTCLPEIVEKFGPVVISLQNKQGQMANNSPIKKLSDDYEIRMWTNRYEFECENGIVSAEIQQHSRYCHHVRIYLNDSQVAVILRGTLNNAIKGLEVYVKSAWGAVYDKDKGFSIPS